MHTHTYTHKTHTKHTLHTHKMHTHVQDYSESEEDSEGFVVDDEEEEEPEWRREMRELTGYDPRK